MPHQRTYSAKASEIQRQWHVIDVSGKILGRTATQIATLLKGKHKPMYTPSIDTGDHVVVVNAEKVAITGNKAEQKTYHRQPRAGFPGALKTTVYNTLQQRHPEDIILHAVRRMLPRNALGRQMMTKLKVYAGPAHPHGAQLAKATK
jgi:large subunit ribosomal protein L13